MGAVQDVAGVGEVAGVQVESNGMDNWKVAVNRWGAVWELYNIPGPGPYNLNVVLADGQGMRSPYSAPPRQR